MEWFLLNIKVRGIFIFFLKLNITKTLYIIRTFKKNGIRHHLALPSTGLTANVRDVNHMSQDSSVVHMFEPETSIIYNSHICF